VIVVVFTDLSADRAEGLFGDVLKHLVVPSYVEDGILFRPFYEGNTGRSGSPSGHVAKESPEPGLSPRNFAACRGSANSA
jgi:hypothetical protein